MTDARTCADCGAPLPADRPQQLCTDHADQVLDVLTQLPDLVDDVNLTITRQTATGARNGPRSSSDTVMAWDDRASKTLASALARLVTWARSTVPTLDLQRNVLRTTRDVAQLTTETTGIKPTPDQVAERAHLERRHAWLADQIAYLTGARWTITANHRRLVDILIDQLDSILTREEAGAFARDITRTRDELLTAADTPAPRLYLGPCRADPLDKGIPCPAEVYVVDHSDNGKGHLCDRCRTVRCPVCSTEHDVAQRRAWLTEAMDDRLATAGDIARGLAGTTGHEATEGQIRGWERRGRLAPHGKDQAGRALYRVGDVIDLAREAAQARDRHADRPESA